MQSVGAPAHFGSATDWLALLVFIVVVYWQPSVSNFGARRSARQYAAQNAQLRATTRDAAWSSSQECGGVNASSCRTEQARDARRRRPDAGQTLVACLKAPPGWLFGVVWSALYALMATALFVYWRRASPDIADVGQRRELRLTTMLAMLVNLLLNKLWTPLYFGASRRTLALFVAVAILGTNVWVLVELFTHDATDHAAFTAAYLWIAYAVWSAYAVFLNAIRVVELDARRRASRGAAASRCAN